MGQPVQLVEKLICARSAGIANDFNGFRDFRRSSPCRNVSQLFSSCFNELQRVAETTCDMVATKPGTQGIDI